MTLGPTNVLLDLDGTILDPFVGITSSYRHALRGLGVAVPSAEDLAWVIGPPLRENFAKILGTTDAPLVERAVALYRERFGDVGWSENVAYPGAFEMLRGLSARGVRLHLATAKPQIYTDRIVERFGLLPLLSSVHGAALDASRDDKAVIVRGILASEGVDPRRAAMVGDRAQDVRAARENGVRSVGALWGYGSKDELLAAGADVLCALPSVVVTTLFGPA